MGLKSRMNRPGNQLPRNLVVGSLLVAGAMGCASTQQTVQNQTAKPEQGTKAETSENDSRGSSGPWVMSSSRSELRSSASSSGLTAESKSYPLTASYEVYPLTASYSCTPGPVHKYNPEVDGSKASGNCGKAADVERREVKVGDWVDGIGTLLRADDKMIAFECIPAVTGISGSGTVDFTKHSCLDIKITFEHAETPGSIYITIVKTDK